MCGPLQVLRGQPPVPPRGAVGGQGPGGAGELRAHLLLQGQGGAPGAPGRKGRIASCEKALWEHS